MKIVVLRALQLGDLLCAVPAFRALRAAYPDAHVALVGLPWAKEFVVRFGRYLDQFIEFPGFPGMHEPRCDAAALVDFLHSIHDRRFDLAIQLQGSGEVSNRLMQFIGAPHTAGFYRAGGWCPDPGRFVLWHDSENEVLRCLRLVERLGVRAADTALEFPLYESDWAEARTLGFTDYACLHPGSQVASRSWPAERFAKVGDALAAQGLKVLLTGSHAEAGLTSRVARAMRAPAVDLAGKTSLGLLGALIARARLLVANDTGVSHIAAAMRTPSVIVCCATDPQRWAPLNQDLHRVLFHEVDCRPCTHVKCPIGHPCALGVSSAAVTNEASRMIAEARSG